MQTLTIDEAVKRIKTETSLDVKAATLRKYCREGKFKKNVHWTKFGKRYLIKMENVYRDFL